MLAAKEVNQLIYICFTHMEEQTAPITESGPEEEWKELFSLQGQSGGHKTTSLFREYVYTGKIWKCIFALVQTHQPLQQWKC